MDDILLPRPDSELSQYRPVQKAIKCKECKIYVEKVIGLVEARKLRPQLDRNAATYKYTVQTCRNSLCLLKAHLQYDVGCEREGVITRRMMLQHCRHSRGLGPDWCRWHRAVCSSSCTEGSFVNTWTGNLWCTQKKWSLITLAGNGS